MIAPLAAQSGIATPDVSVLCDGRTSLEHIISRIDKAESSVVINMFIWRDDPAGNRVGRSVLRAADRGVEVIITKDKLGAIFELGEENRQSFFHKKYGPLTALKHRVINAYSSNPNLFSWIVQQPNELVEKLRRHRNVSLFDSVVRNDHSKFVVIDDEILFIGGMNFEERNVSSDSNGLIWRDYLFECVDKDIVTNLKDRLAGDPSGESPFEFVLNDNSANQRFEVEPCVKRLIDAAAKTCHIEMAYFCDPQIRDSVIRAADRGVNVQIVIPAWANIQNERNLKTMQQIFERTAGEVAIYLSPDMLHSKMLDIDGHTILSGSANFNERALNKFSELNVLMSGEMPCTVDIRRTFVERRDASKKVLARGELNFRKIKEWCEFVFG